MTLRNLPVPLRVSGTFVRYACVGAGSLLVDVGTLWLLYNVVGAPLWLATTTGFWLSFAVNFTANKYVTFAIRTGGRGQLARYAVLVALNYLGNLGIVTGLVALGLPAVLSKIVAVATLTSLNYFAYRWWVFRR